jgi:hypothetical protein
LIEFKKNLFDRLFQTQTVLWGGGLKMRRKFAIPWIAWAILLSCLFFPITLKAQASGASSALSREKSEGQCPFCGQPWRGRVDLKMTIPGKLPTPKSQIWISRLRQALIMAEVAKAQYEADQMKFGLTIPYLQIIPQIDSHIAWISQLFSAYGLPANGKPIPARTSATLPLALHVGKKLEADLAEQYEWLLINAEDKDTKKVLNIILTQTKIDVIIFDHAIRLLALEANINIESF